MVRAEIRSDGRMSGSEADKEPDPSDYDRAAMRRQVRRQMRERGQRPQREMVEQMFANKMLRAIYSENQLAEVLTDFWFNHFNVDASKREARPYLLSYERDAIRPNVLGDFHDLVSATASHPAMLLYLDNARSRADAGRRTTAELRPRGGRAGTSGRIGTSGRTGTSGRIGATGRMGNGRESFGNQRGSSRSQQPQRPGRREAGLNENYARELMELHTLGVDGGYSQQDVIEVARALTGWMVLPPTGTMRERIDQRLPNERIRQRLGFLERDGFFFNPAFHDAEKKQILGRKFPAGRGIEDGLEVIDLLSSQPSTARYVTRKLAQRFVSDEPSEALQSQLELVFSRTNGNIAEVLRAMVQTEEFWLARRTEIKSPFELVISTVRALDAEVRNPGPLGKWLEQLGEPLYRYQAPTGYPETSDFWVNTGGLLNRMNFGLELAGGMSGLRFDLLGLLDGREPESPEDAVRTFAEVLMPTRDHQQTVAALLPSLGVESLGDRLSRRIDPIETSDDDFGGSMITPAEEPEGQLAVADGIAPEALTQIVGLLIGSPEFQRR